MTLYDVHIVNPFNVGRETVKISARDSLTAVYLAGVLVAYTEREDWIVSGVVSHVGGHTPPAQPVTPATRLECLRSTLRAAQRASDRDPTPANSIVVYRAEQSLWEYAQEHDITFTEAVGEQ